MPKVHLYLRVSSQSQSHGHGPERQQSNWRNFIKTNDGYEAGSVYRDLGVSAFDGSKAKTRPALDRLIADIDVGVISPDDYVYVELLDRLSRASIMPALNLLTSILQTGVSIATGQQVFTNSDDISSAILATIELGRAHSESAAKSVRTTSYLNAKTAQLDQGIPAKVRVPSWIRYEANPDPKYVTNEFADTVQLMFKLFTSGYSLRSVVRTLNERGIQSISGAGFSPSAVRRYLNSIEVTGQFSFRGKAYQILPPIVSEEMYWEAQAILKANKSTNGGHKRQPSLGKRSLFRNLKCGKCGSVMRYIQKTKKSNARLRCANSSLGRCDIKRPVPYDEFEHLILSHLTTINFKPDQSISAAAIAGFSAELDDVTSQIEQATDLLPSMTNPAPLVARINDLEERRSELNDRIAEARTQAQAVTNHVIDADAVANADNEERQRIASIISRSINRITCHPILDDEWMFHLDAIGGISHICSFGDDKPVTLVEHVPNQVPEAENEAVI